MALGPQGPGERSKHFDGEVFFVGDPKLVEKLAQIEDFLTTEEKGNGEDSLKGQEQEEGRFKGNIQGLAAFRNAMSLTKEMRDEKEHMKGKQVGDYDYLIDHESTFMHPPVRPNFIQHHQRLPERQRRRNM